MTSLVVGYPDLILNPFSEWRAVSHYIYDIFMKNLVVEKQFNISVAHILFCYYCTSCVPVVQRLCVYVNIKKRYFIQVHLLHCFRVEPLTFSG